MVGESRIRKWLSHSQQPKNLVTSSRHETMRTIRCWVSTGMLKMETSITLGASQHLIGQRCNRNYNRNQKACKKVEGTSTKRRTLASPGVRKRKSNAIFFTNDLPVEPCRECVLMSPSCVKCFPSGRPLWLVPLIRGREDELGF
jgi:hypothetical protein